MTYRLLYNIHSQCTIMHIEMLSIGKGNPNLREWNESREEQPANFHLLSAGKGSRENHAGISDSFLVEEWELRTAVWSPSLQKVA